MIGVREVRVGDHEDVRAELVLVLGGHLRHGLAVVLLVALDDELHVHGQAAASLDHGFDAGDLRVVLPLVVVGAARPDRAILDPGLEGWMLPELDRVDRLNVHVPVDQDRGSVGIHDPLGEESGMRPGRPDLGLESKRFELPLVELQRRRDVLVVLLVGADARNAQELEQLVHEFLLVFLDVVECGVQVHAGSSRGRGSKASFR